VRALDPTEQWSAGDAYITSIYWAFQTMSTIGYGDVVATSTHERVVSMLAMFCGSCIYAFGITSVPHRTTAPAGGTSMLQPCSARIQSTSPVHPPCADVGASRSFRACRARTNTSGASSTRRTRSTVTSPRWKCPRTYAPSVRRSRPYFELELDLSSDRHDWCACLARRHTTAVRLYFVHYQNAADTFNESEVLQMLSPGLRRSVCSLANAPLLRKVSFFENAEEKYRRNGVLERSLPCAAWMPLATLGPLTDLVAVVGAGDARQMRGRDGAVARAQPLCA
jgi:hypothetical protein